ncbi:hypothetical protein D9M71_616790 [compost metagenome]
MLQPMHIRDKPGKTAVKGGGKSQVVDDRTRRLGKALPRHDQRNSRRIGHQHHGSDSPEQLLDRYRFDLPAHHPVIGIGGFHHHFRQAREQPFELLGSGITAVTGMQLVTQIPQPQPLVAHRIETGDTGQAFE